MRAESGEQKQEALSCRSALKMVWKWCRTREREMVNQNEKELGPWETMRVMAFNAIAQTSFVLVVLSSGFKTHCIFKWKLCT